MNWILLSISLLENCSDIIIMKYALKFSRSIRKQVKWNNRLSLISIKETMITSLQQNKIFNLDSAGKINNSVTLLLIAYYVIISCFLYHSCCCPKANFDSFASTQPHSIRC